MLDCVTEQSSGVYRWTFKRMLPGLPSIGTPFFGRLVRELQPYGISPAGVFIEAPTSQLADVNLRIFLLEGQRAMLRISLATVELNLDYLSAGDEVRFPALLTSVFDILKELDPDSQRGGSQLTLRAHLSLQSQAPDVFLAEHIRPPANQERLQPGIVHYNVVLDKNSAAALLRIGMTRSLAFENALFVELVAEYDGPPDPAHVFESLGEDAKAAFGLVGLNPRSKEGV
jgi:hypothetical protein